MSLAKEISLRERLHAVVNKAERNDVTSRVYNAFISAVAIASLIPLMFREQTPTLELLDTVAVYILLLDYNLHWFTCDYDSKHKGWHAFALYPFTPYALFDLISLLPSFGLLTHGFSLLRMLRFVKVLRYSKSFSCIADVIKSESKVLLSVLGIAVAYIFMSALAMFCNEAESDTFHTFFDALYWATTALTTVGYGDIFPRSDIGRLISMVSSLFGIAIIALPAGIVTGGYIEQIHKLNANQTDDNVALPPIRKPKAQTLLRFGAVIIIGILMNEACYMLAKGLPLWLDMVGTCYAALMMGPMAGLLVGLVDNAYLALSGMGNSSIVYYFVSACAALIIGLLLGDGRKHTWKRIAWVGILAASATALLSFALRMLLHGGAPDATWEASLYQSATGAGLPGWTACLYTIFAGKALELAVSVPVLYGAVALTRAWERRRGLVNGCRL